VEDSRLRSEDEGEPDEKEAWHERITAKPSPLLDQSVYSEKSE
jgi:hypothetical protein